MLLLLCFQTQFKHRMGIFYPEKQRSAVPLMDIVGLKVHEVLKEMGEMFCPATTPECSQHLWYPDGPS